MAATGTDIKRLPESPVVIFGAGGHARVVADALLGMTPAVDFKGYLDDRSELWGTTLNGMPVGSRAQLETDDPERMSKVIVAVGDNRDRERIALEIEQAGFGFATALHRTTTVGYGVVIGDGTVLLAGTIANAGAQIGSHVIINTSASVDHDCIVGDFAHISPGAHLAGNVRVGRGVHIGTGAAVIPGVRIGDWATVGAGATVVHDVAAYTTVVGTPAMPIPHKRAAR